MNLEVLISAMNISSNEDFCEGFIWLQNKGIPIVMINQCTNVKPNLYHTKKNLKIISVHSSGLSKSRNQALIHAEKNICHISDDDLKYVSNFNIIIESAYSNNPEADIIIFQIKTENNIKYKNYNSEKKWLNRFDLAKVSSVEITFKRKSILTKKIKFDEQFGLGARFSTGEEFIFLSDALSQGLKILYLPIPIVIHSLESSGKKLNNKKLIEAKGAMFFRVYGKLGYLYALAFSLKKYQNSNVNFIKFINCILKGMKNYRQLKE